jgi:hypothetical protein
VSCRVLSDASVPLPFFVRDVLFQHVRAQHPLFADQVALNVVFTEQFVIRGVVMLLRQRRFDFGSPRRPARVNDQHEQCDHAEAGTRSGDDAAIECHRRDQRRDARDSQNCNSDEHHCPVWLSTPSLLAKGLR